MGMDKLSLFAVLFALAGIVMIFALSSGIGENGIVGAGSNAPAGSGANAVGSNSGSVGCGGGGGCGSAAGGCGCGGGITNTGGGSGSNAGDAGGSAAGSAGGSSAGGSTGGNGAGSDAGSIGGAGAGSGSVQDIYIKALGNGRYDKGEVRVKAGAPVRFHFSAEPNAGCGKLVVMEEFGVRLVSYNGEEKISEFTPTQKGTYEYHCGMHMFVGRMIVE